MISVGVRGQMLALVGQDFKAPIINMLKELKETTFKQWKESMMTMIHQMENINEEMGIVK